MRIVLVEDHALARLALRTALGAHGEVVGEAADGPAGLALIERERPDVAVIDIGLPGMNGIDLTHAIRTKVPETRVVVVTMLDSPETVIAALGAGADAYVVKSADPAEIVDAVRAAGAGGAYFDRRIAHVVLARFGRSGASPGDSPLTPRETEVLRRIADGAGNAEIAEQLSIGLGTVKGHVRDILEKLKAADRTQAAVTALRRGYI